MRLLNLTPHEIVVYRDSVVVVRLAPEQAPARVTERHAPRGAVSHEGVDVPVVARSFGETTGLPDPEPGVMLVVSPVVFDIHGERDDLVIPVELVRDDAGRVIGCRAFAVRGGRGQGPR